MGVFISVDLGTDRSVGAMVKAMCASLSFVCTNVDAIPGSVYYCERLASF